MLLYYLRKHHSYSSTGKGQRNIIKSSYVVRWDSVRQCGGGDIGIEVILTFNTTDEGTGGWWGQMGLPRSPSLTTIIHNIYAVQFAVFQPCPTLENCFLYFTVYQIFFKSKGWTCNVYETFHFRRGSFSRQTPVRLRVCLIHLPWPSWRHVPRRHGLFPLLPLYERTSVPNAVSGRNSLERWAQNLYLQPRPKQA